ncbi:MAG TPA: bifunctional diaminohydroxyphosphoribosylaminopyrimidine deaminase/5-amino-6-(5-phosphoribosylamino)uracil reductase RibD [Gemmatimonadaceae bacterium]
MSQLEGPDRERDTAFMRRALVLAREGCGQTAPNPLVGAVVVRDDRIVGEGFHARYGEAHAEVNALRAAGEAARGATLYVTLEPCVHQGKTPPCTDAVIAAGVSRVVVPVRDPSSIARGGLERLRAAGVRVTVGTERENALELNAAFFNAHGSDRPWVTMKLALSAEGAIAGADRHPQWLSGVESRREVHRMRAAADAIAVGLGTVIADDPALTVRDVPAPRVAPTRVVFDARLRIPPDAALVRTAREIPTIVVARDAEGGRVAALREAGVEVLLASNAGDAMRQLRQRGIRALLVEGGARLAGSLLNDSLVDRLVIFQTPTVLGAGALQAFGSVSAEVRREIAGAPIVERRVFGEDVMTTAALHPLPCSPD